MDILRTTKRIAKRILFRKPETGNNKSGEFCCSVCGAVNVGMNPLPIYYLANYQKYKFVHNIFFTETTNLLYYSCKNCNASDRDRLYALYLQDYFRNK
ncbi:MAG TPA: hypothetical protein VHZ50_00680, partial [Puia sp.]|nr:hypothetical protein [Puia sp.]